MKAINQLWQKLGIAGLISIASLAVAWAAILMLLSNNLQLAIILAIVAFLLDCLDGFAARKLGKASEFGRQLDGMIDAFNYSLFAALLVWHVLLPGLPGAIVGFLILAIGIIRLLGFNEEGYIHHKGRLYYRGVVTCHLSLAAILFVFLQQLFAIPPFIIAVILTLLAVLQLSNIRTRKTGALLFWIPVSLFIIVGALVWL